MKTLLKNKTYFVLNLTKFDTAGNTTGSNTVGNDLSPEMKTYYSDYLIDNAAPRLIHDQFGQKHPIPKNGGKTIEFRKFSPLPKALTPLTEGVTPDGQPLNVSVITATVGQYGGWVQLPDMFLLTSIDNGMVQTTKQLGSQAGRTLDTITREVLNAGTSVQYGDGTVSHRYDLDQTNDKMSLVAIKKAARFLKTQNATPIDDSFVAIVHPDIEYDITSDTNWIDIHKYAQPENIYKGEIGKIGGVRFVESTEAKIFHANDLTAGARNLSVKTAVEAAADTIAVKEVITEADATAMVGRKVLIGGAQYEIESASAAAAGSATVTLTGTLTVAADTAIYPGEAGTAGVDVYSTLVLGSDAYGVTEIEGGGLEHIVKPLGSGGATDPLNQRASAAWKATKTAERLVETFMIRIETASTFESGAN